MGMTPAGFCQKFQSTRPVWGATPQCPKLPDKLLISIHTPRVGRDPVVLQRHRQPLRISIHTPRVGRDALVLTATAALPVFQSTRPVWGATCLPNT